MSERIPSEVRKSLPPDTARSWEEIAEHLPEQLVLVGGTALAVHLQHRLSQDLDFFFTEPGVDLAALREIMEALPGGFAVTREANGTLNGLYRATKVQFLDTTTQRPLDEPTVCAGLKVAGIRDIMAMKLKAVGDRPALRDYFDLMRIEEQTDLTAEEGLLLYRERFDIPVTHDTIPHIISALGYLDDVDEDDLVPVSRAEVESYWRARQPQIVSSTSWRGPLPPRRVPPLRG